MIKKVFLLVLLFPGALFANVKVATTIYPLYSVVKEVGGNKVDLNMLIPFGTKAHQFEPKSKEMAKLSSCDIFIISSSEMEPWAGKVISTQKLEQKTFDMSQKVVLKTHKEYKGGKVYDPHYWLSFGNYVSMIKATKELLSKIDPSNSKYYETNANSYANKVLALKFEYDVTLKSCNKKVVANLDAFAYLADDYGIAQYSIYGASPDARQIKELVDIIKKEKIKVVFFEQFASDKTAKTIANEAGVASDTLRSIDNITEEESQKGIGYIDIMRSNLVKLKSAMDCR